MAQPTDDERLPAVAWLIERRKEVGFGGFRDAKTVADHAQRPLSPFDQPEWKKPSAIQVFVGLRHEESLSVEVVENQHEKIG